MCVCECVCVCEHTLGLFGTNSINDVGADALEALARGQRLSNAILSLLSNKGLIEVEDVSTLDTAPGQRDLLFHRITERGKIVLGG